jgi:hypothetical protein
VKKDQIRIYLAILIVAVCVSCKKSNDITAPQRPSIIDSSAEITDYKIVGLDPGIVLSPQSVNIRFPDTILSGKDLIASFSLTSGAEATVSSVTQVSGVTKNNFESRLTYAVKGPGGITKYWNVTATNNGYSNDWGLGNFVKKSLSNNRSYDWYLDQANTGSYSGINCGPTSVTMALKWADSLFNKTPEDARNYYPGSTDLWGSASLREYIKDNGFLFKVTPLGADAESTRDSLKKQLDQGHILIILLTMGSIRYMSGPYPDNRTDRFYTETFNHFIVVKGYKEVDDEFYFEVYDPYNYAAFNMDRTPKGKDRYYRYEDVYTGCLNMDNDATIIYKK